MAVPRLRAVFLVGFMGAGKSSVGRALGQRLSWLFEDLDDRVVQSEGRSIAEIFCHSGEAAFRLVEHSALKQVCSELKRGASRIIALGGGAFAQRANMDLLRSSGAPIVFLSAPVEELWARCARQAAENGIERPLLQDLDQFRALHDSRRKSYMKASLKIETAGLGVDAIAAEIAEKLGLASRAAGSESGETV
jgi:shikimate kinase